MWGVHAAAVQSLSSVQFFGTPQIAAHQAPLSMEFHRQEYWSGLPFPCPGDLPDPGTETTPPTWHVSHLPLSHLGRLVYTYTGIFFILKKKF